MDTKKKKTHPFENKQTKENIVVSRINKQTEQMSKKNIKKKKKSWNQKAKAKKERKQQCAQGHLRAFWSTSFVMVFSSVLSLRAYLNIAYFAETEKLLLKLL